MDEKEDYKDTSCCVTTFLEEDEKEALERLGWRSGRSVSGYIRQLCGYRSKQEVDNPAIDYNDNNEKQQN